MTGALTRSSQVQEEYYDIILTVNMYTKQDEYCDVINLAVNIFTKQGLLSLYFVYRPQLYFLYLLIFLTAPPVTHFVV